MKSEIKIIVHKASAMKKVLLGGAEMCEMVCEALTDDILSVLAAGESEICGLNIERKWIPIAF